MFDGVAVFSRVSMKSVTITCLDTVFLQRDTCLVLGGFSHMHFEASVAVLRQYSTQWHLHGHTTEIAASLIGGLN